MKPLLPLLAAQSPVESAKIRKKDARRSRNWIKPAQPLKSGKVAIRGAKGQSVLDRQCSQVSIRHEIAVDAGCGEELTQ